MTTTTMRFFNTAGPIQPEIHYHIPPIARLDADDLMLLIRQRKYFVLHAPRQTGKTSALFALRDRLNASGEFRCVYVNVEVGQSAREDVAAAMRAILSALARGARHALEDSFVAEVWPGILDDAGPNDAFGETLSRWSQADARPLVLMIDEIDALIGDTLLAVLRQLRAGYPERPRRFPQSVILCGVRDVRDYRIRSSAENAIIAGGSAFNIRAESLRLGDFSRDEVESLLAQHTGETGQEFTDEARRDIWELSQGQPWLVNALAYEACFKNKAGRDRSRSITPGAIQEAREQLILRRETHLDQLTDKLQEERVRRVVEPLLSGVGATDSIADDDLQYVRDLGLVAQGGPVAIANPIYREVIPRALTWTTQEMSIHHDPAWYADDRGALRVDDLLAAFQEFFREHSEHWMERFQYKEAGPQLLLQAFFQRIVNSGGRIEREYGLGRGRTDLLLVWPVGGDRRSTQKVVIECKVQHRGLERTLREGLEQTRAYMAAALRRKGTSCSSTAPRAGHGTTRCIAARKTKGARRSLCGVCERQGNPGFTRGMSSHDGKERNISMKRVLRMLPVLLLWGTPSEGLQRTDTEFKIFQFPADMIPRIDGSIDDWEMVPEEYVYGTDQLKDTVMGKGTNHDPEDLDVRVRVGWVKGLNRLYFLYEAYDDFWNMYYARGDLFEIAVDADRSGGPNIVNSQIEDPWESHFMFKGVHAQNYHIFTPPGEGRDWVFVWGCQPWIGKLPYSNHAYSYDFKEGESGNLVLECWITPFDYAPHDGPERASVSKLVENGLIALSWSVLDYDEDHTEYEGFWNLSHETRMDNNASNLCAFRLMPLEPEYLKPLEAEYAYSVVDMERRMVAFNDRSRGEITSWSWDFGDGMTSDEQHPIHQYGEAGAFVVTLNVEGPGGKARRVKVFEVMVK